MWIWSVERLRMRYKDYVWWFFLLHKMYKLQVEKHHLWIFAKGREWARKGKLAFESTRLGRWRSSSIMNQFYLFTIFNKYTSLAILMVKSWAIWRFSDFARTPTLNIPLSRLGPMMTFNDIKGVEYHNQLKFQQSILFSNHIGWCMGLFKWVSRLFY